MDEERRRTTAGDCSHGGDPRTYAPTGRITSIQDLADDVLELVLARICSVVCLIRAAATCRPWRRVIGDAGFLRRFGALHAPPVLGHYHVGCYETIFVPSPSSPGDIIDVGDRASLDFVHRDVAGDLELVDSRGGLLALDRRYSSVVVVCNPMTRRHTQLHLPWKQLGGGPSLRLGTFLLDADADTGETGTTAAAGMSNFRVLHVRLQENHRNYAAGGSTSVVASVFSARDGRWVALGSADADELFPGAGVRADMYTHIEFVGRAGGSLCWSAGGRSILHVDEVTGEMSSFTMPAPANEGPPLYYSGNLRVVVGSGVTATARLARITDGGELEVLTVPRGGEACTVERRVSLPQMAGIQTSPDDDIIERWRKPWCFVEAATPRSFALLPPDEQQMWTLSADFELEAMTLPEEHEQQRSTRRVIKYELPWPPTISACLPLPSR
ncbi:hypothetical protein ACP70R_032398 [Stipagrostis hirtigluma subsp. patula]